MKWEKVYKKNKKELNFYKKFKLKFSSYLDIQIKQKLLIGKKHWLF